VFALKALTIYQPWATLLATGQKRIETRSWATGYRGWLILHAAVKWSADLRELSASPMFAEMLQGTPGYGSTEGTLFTESEPPAPPLGAVVGVAKLVATDSVDDPRLILSDRERELGDYSSGRWAWIFEEPIAFKNPIPIRGFQGMWNPPPTILEAALKLVRYRPQA